MKLLASACIVLPTLVGGSCNIAIQEEGDQQFFYVYNEECHQGCSASKGYVSRGQKVGFSCWGDQDACCVQVYGHETGCGWRVPCGSLLQDYNGQQATTLPRCTAQQNGTTRPRCNA